MTTPAPQSGQGSPFTRTPFILSALVVLFVVALGIALTLQDEPRQVVNTEPSFSAPPPERPQASEAPTETGGCPDTVESDALPAGPPAATWAPRGRVEAPYSREHGPVLGRCYSRTPEGAAFAAANFLAAITDPAGVEQAIRDLTAPGPGQESLLAILEADPSRVTGTGAGYDIRAFAVLSFTPDASAITMAIRTENRSLGVVPIGLVWTDGTWLVQLPDDGDLPARGVDRLDEFYIPWAA